MGGWRVERRHQNVRGRKGKTGYSDFWPNGIFIRKEHCCVQGVSVRCSPLLMLNDGFISEWVKTQATAQQYEREYRWSLASKHLSSFREINNPPIPAIPHVISSDHSRRSIPYGRGRRYEAQSPDANPRSQAVSNQESILAAPHWAHTALLRREQLLGRILERYLEVHLSPNIYGKTDIFMLWEEFTKLRHSPFTFCHHQFIPGNTEREPTDKFMFRHWGSVPYLHMRHPQQGWGHPQASRQCGSSVPG